MGYQNFFATRLFTDIGAADTTITLENPPTPTSGRLVLEARNTSKREIISYTGVSGNDITGVTRGVGGTSATDHKKNSLVEMNVVAEDLADALAVPSDIITRFDEVVSDHVASGLVVTDDTGLTADISAGVAYINGIRLDVAAVNNRTFTASKDTYVDLGDNGVLDYNEVSNGAAPPALAANHLRLAKVVTDGSNTTSVYNYYINPGYLVADNAWKRGLPAVNTVTNNGLHSVDLEFASSVANVLSPGMRLCTVRKVQAPTYMASLNGTNQYFTKTSPLTGALGTVANNFSIIADIALGAYQIGMICGRADATPNNAIFFRVEDNGQVTIAVFNGAGNFRQQTTYRSIYTNYNRKKVNLVATWASGTINIYIDGKSAPLKVAVTGGTAPTTAGTAGDWSIGRAGAFNSQYFSGGVSSVAIFDAVLTEATIRSYMNQPVLGNEANCIGAWDLNNRSTDQSALGNNLTAQNSAGYLSNVSPHTTDASGVSNGYTDFSIIQKVNGTTVTVQTADGNTIPTTGGIQEVLYSHDRTPYNFPSNEDSWSIDIHFRETLGTTATAGTVTGSFHGHKLPVGKWKARYDVDMGCNAGATQALGATSSLSTSSSAHSPVTPNFQDFSYIAANTDFHQKHTKQDVINISAITDLYIAVSPHTTCSSFSAQWGFSPGGVKYVNGWL